EKRVFLVILFTSFSGSLVSRIPGAVQSSVKIDYCPKCINAFFDYNILALLHKRQKSLTALRRD
ncbi:hypothetical protein, partial [Escherichia coli]|uniref:hypothetical protein n=1 Tax=Escherichia coli TaxID=562 RepID=UPI0039894085